MSMALSTNIKAIPNLENAVEDVVSVGSEYWTPENMGESKRGFVLGIEVQRHERQSEDTKNTGEVDMIELPCVVFAEQTSDGFKQYSNGSKRLVAMIGDGVTSGRIKYGETPIQIKYAGKKKNKTNAFKSDAWDVRVLIVNQEA